MDKQVAIEREKLVEKLHGARRIELILVLLHGKAQEMTIVVQDNAENGNAAQCR